MEAVPAVSSSVERSSQNPLISLAPRLYTISHPNKCSKLENDEISGLALAGAQTTIEAWKRDEVPPVENDGILTAEDVSTLDLQGTWLVTLSACDTGSGQARAGEGVMGLRRGFMQAGAQNLLMTLWPIDDEKTVRLMTDFYTSAHKLHD